MEADTITIYPNDCYSKSEYARKIKKSPTWVNNLIDLGRLTEVKIRGCSFVTDRIIVKQEAEIT